jgi:hypothetical protein
VGNHSVSEASEKSNCAFRTKCLIVSFVKHRLVIVLSVYCLGGVIFMAVVKGARGVEVVPNLTFWQDFPALVKDGCLFVVSKIRRQGSYTPV